LYAQARLPQKHHERFAQLRALNLKTGRTWAIKESLREFWQQPTREAALVHWKPWYRWATHSRLPPVIKNAACGFRRFENFKTAIFFHCGGLQLYPLTHAKPG